jgi:hypothetical protein
MVNAKHLVHLCGMLIFQKKKGGAMFDSLMVDATVAW